MMDIGEWVTKRNVESGRYSDERGQGMIEYGLIIALIAMLVIAVMLVLGPNIERMFSDVVDQNATGEREATLSSAIHS